MPVEATVIVVWLIIGALGGYIAGILIRDRKRGFGLVGNIVIGLIGALIGGFLFEVFNISITSATIPIDAVIAAVVGSLILVALLALIRR
ncbi:MAG: GlsB/YeaQ/YmgE family stress response membrane protein [Anaerolineae bacterium]|nr:GlsB/YeaQ/YmgE family stress response membrane protein [Anaerolineae bacterium]